jgi:integrase
MSVVARRSYGNGIALRQGQPARRKVDFPRIEETDADIRFLAPEGVEALLRAVDLDHEWGPTEHALYLTAAMTGLRQGELLALRWRDVDWLAGRVRVRRNYVRGEFGAPKSRRSSRSVPLADRLMAELDAQHRVRASAATTISSSPIPCSASRWIARGC